MSGGWGEGPDGGVGTRGQYLAAVLGLLLGLSFFVLALFWSK